MRALVWVISDDQRGERFLALSGWTAPALSAALSGPALQGAAMEAAMDFLCAHEPDLIACAEALAVDPQLLAAVRDRVNS